ncbi:hypothetical protein C8Q70DRAFT_1051713 [Cubamyces menziesii]|nr:hypothetical protein C8Q70DRAFT_1051713 [Cubamyces menziesii]
MYHHLRYLGTLALLAAYAWVGCVAQGSIFEPTILSPNGSSVWTVGSVQTVRWDNHGTGFAASKTGSVALAYFNPNDTTDNWGYDYRGQPLAKGFPISDQNVNVVVPDVPTGNFYYILMLDAANGGSPLFTIINPASPKESTENITFPATLSVSSAPPATPIPLSTQTSSSGAATSATAPDSSTTSTTTEPTSNTSGGCRHTAERGWASLIPPLFGFVVAAVV